MEENLRRSGIDVIGNVPWGTHFCQFYQTKEDLTGILVPYFKAGLENNEFCIWVTSQPPEVEDAKEALRRAVPDLDSYLDKGQIEIIPYTCLHVTGSIYDSERVINYWIEKLNHALESGYEGLRLSGNTSWLEKKDWGYFVNYMGKMDDIIGKYRMIALGSYFVDKYDTTEIIEIVSNHQFSLSKKEGKWERIDNFGRKKAEEATVRATKDWEHTFDAVPDLIAIIDTEYRIVRANRAMAARLGVTAEECAGLTCYRVVHGTDEPPSICPHRQLLKDELEHTTEVHEGNLGGDFIVSVSPLHNSEGKLTGCIHVARDINERKLAEEALLHSEKCERARSDELAILLDAVPAAVWITHDPQALQITGNRLSYEWLRLPESANVSKAAPEGERLETYRMFKDGVEIPLTDMPVRMSASGKEIRDYEFDLVYPDGTTRHLLGNARPLRDDQGNPQGSVSAFIDITKRKKAEEALLKSEERYRMLFTNMTDGFGLVEVICNNDGKPYDYRYLEINPAFELYLGVKREQILGKTMLEIFPNVSSIAIEKYCEVELSGKPIHFEIFSLVANKYLDIYAFSPEKMKLALVLRDISERKEAETKLKETLENLENLVKERTIELEKAYNSLKESEKGLAEAQKMAHIGNWVWDIATDKAYWSDELYRIFRRDSQEAAPSYNEYLNYVHPDDRDYVGSAFAETLNGKPYDIEHRIILTNGEERTVHVQAEVVFDDENIPIRTKGIVQDLTERQKTEEEIQTLAKAVESSNDAIATGSLDGIIKSWNKGAEQTYGYKAEEILGKDASILEPENLKGDIKHFNEKIKRGEKVQNYETLRLKKDGTLINVSVTLSPIFDASGRMISFSVISRDITERKEAEEARRKEIHHRIKNNLQVISSLLDLQAEKFSDGNVREAFRESQNRVISMSLIHEELYEGKETDTLNFSEYIQKLAENLFQTYKTNSKNIHLHIDLEENAFFNMDTAIPLGIIVNELISNSLKHAFVGRDKGEIRIILHREEKGECKNEGYKSTRFIMTVSDNGVGIPENLDIEDLDSLGLQLVASLVEQLDGELELKRKNGTEFTMKFTVDEKDDQASAPAVRQLI